MSRNTGPPSDRQRVAALEAKLHDVQRHRPTTGMAFRDLDGVYALPATHGDIYVYSRTVGGILRLGAGSEGHVLTRRSSSPVGIQWEATQSAHPDLSTHDSMGLATDAEVTNRLLDHAGPTLRVSGITAPSPMSPAENVEAGWHFERIDYQPTGGYFTYSAGGNIITVNKSGRYLISAQFAWNEKLVADFDFATELAYVRAVADFVLGDRWLHVAAGGVTVIDSHKAPSANYTTNEGATQIVLTAGAQISASYQYFDRTQNVSPSYYPTVQEAGVYWPSLAVTFLGPQ